METALKLRMTGTLDDHTRQQAIADANLCSTARLGVIVEFRWHRVLEEFIHRERQRDASDVAARERKEALVHGRQSIARSRRAWATAACSRA